MGIANNYLKDEILDHISTIGAWTAPVTTYLALLKTAPAASDTVSGSAAKEVETPAANGYDREIIAFGAAASGVMANTGTITFGPATALWTEVVGYWITDHLTAGNILFQGALTANKVVINTGSLVFAIGDITVTAS